MKQKIMWFICLLPPTLLFLLGACSQQNSQVESERNQVNGAKSSSVSNHANLPNYSALVADVTVRRLQMVPDKDTMVIEYDSLFILLGSLERMIRELRASVYRANELSRDEFEKTTMWEERKRQAVIEAEKNYLPRISNLFGKSVADGIKLRTSALVSSSTFIYDPDKETMELETQEVKFKNARRIPFLQINQLMYDKVQYGSGWNRNPHIIRTMYRSIKGDQNNMAFYFSLKGPSFSTNIAPRFKKAVGNSEVIADIEFIIRYSTEDKNINFEISSVTYRRVGGDLLIRWGSITKYINFASGRRAFREIIVTRNGDSFIN